MTEETLEYRRSVRQLQDANRGLVKVCHTLPKDLAACLIAEQLGARVDRFVGQAWPAEVNAGLAKVYNDLATVIKSTLKSKVQDEEEKHLHVESLLVCCSSFLQAGGLIKG